MPQSAHTDRFQKLPGDLTFLFWNLDDKNLLTSICLVVEHYNVDVLILAECKLSTEDILRVLNPVGQTAEFDAVKCACPRIAMFTRFPSSFVRPVIEKDKYTICSLQLPGEDELLLAAAHLKSLLRANQETLDDLAKRLALEIRHVEAEHKHERTLVVGDLNMNPFASGIVSEVGLRATMSRRIALRKNKSSKDSHSFFYNPMWSQMGERFDAQTQMYSPPGTYYYNSSDHVCYYWNMFDQVLLRPDLLERWSDANLKIVASVDDFKFLTERAQIPGGEHGSDHLPIVFKLNRSS